MTTLNALSNSVSRFFTQSDPSMPAVSLRRRLRWQIRHKLILLGWPGIIAVGLLVMSPVLFFSAIRPMQARLGVAKHSVASAQEQIAVAGNTEQGGVATPREQLTEFYKYFPAEKNAPKWLEKLDEVAEQNGLSLNEGEYKVTQDKVGQLIRLRIAFPVQGKYPQIREFLASLSKEIPPIALENIQFGRNNIVDATVEAKVKMVLYLVQKS